MTGGQHTDRTLARRRFKAELTAFEAEFAAMTSEVDGDPRTWETHGQALLDDARDALEEDDIEQGWVYLHAAQRLAFYRFDPDQDTDALRGEARELVEEAKGSGLGWRRQAVVHRLTTDDGSLRESIGIPDLQSAAELLDEGYENIHLKRRHLQSQVTYLAIGAVAVIILIVAVSLLSIVAAGMPSPFFDLSAASGEAPAGPMGNNTTATSTPTATPPPQPGAGANTTTATASPTPTDPSTTIPPPESNRTASGPPGDSAGGGQPAPVGFLLYIVLFGMLGAALFGTRSIRKRPSSTTTPQYLSSRSAAAIRLIVGAASALAIFFFLTAGILDVSVGADDSNGPLFITLAFVAGYSERLVHTTVEFVASTAVPETSDESGG